MSLLLKTLKTQKANVRRASTHYKTQSGSANFQSSSSNQFSEDFQFHERYYNQNQHERFQQNRHGSSRGSTVYDIPFSSGGQYRHYEEEAFEDDDEPVTEERLYYGDERFVFYDQEAPVDPPGPEIDPVIIEPEPEPVEPEEEEPFGPAEEEAIGEGARCEDVIYKPTKPVSSPIHQYHSQISRLVDQVKDATCTIRVYDARARSVAHGSGCFIESSGVIVTAAHVVGAEKQVAIVTRDAPNIIRRAIVRAVDRFADIAILEVNRPRGEVDPKPYNFPVVQLAPRGYEAKEGDFCLLVGAPQSLKYHSTISTGVVNHTPRKLGDLQEKLVIQHDAMCGGGTSGGPLMNANGEMIGVHILRSASRSAGGSNFGFAAPLSELYFLYDTFKNATCKYELGIQYVEHDDPVYGKIMEVTASSTGNFKKGDVILGIVGEEKESHHTLSGALKRKVIAAQPFTVSMIRKHTTKDGKVEARKGTVKISPVFKPKKL